MLYYESVNFKTAIFQDLQSRCLKTIGSVLPMVCGPGTHLVYRRYLSFSALEFWNKSTTVTDSTCGPFNIFDVMQYFTKR